MGSLPEDISCNDREAITAAHIKRNPHPRNTDENSTIGSLFSLQELNNGMELSIFNVPSQIFILGNQTLKVISLILFYYF